MNERDVYLDTVWECDITDHINLHISGRQYA